MIICRGIGLEPQIIIGQMRGTTFEPTTSIVFNPILTHSNGDEQEIVIRNPCTFPVEIYNLEFDKQFLEEEKVIQFYLYIILNDVLYRYYVFCLVMMKIITFSYRHELQEKNYHRKYNSFMRVRPMHLECKCVHE